MTPTYDSANCLISLSTDQSCLQCRLKDSSGNYLHLHSGKCCPHKQYNDSGTCTALTDTNCLIPSSSSVTQCSQCADGYHINASNACAADVANCITHHTDGTCT